MSVEKYELCTMEDASFFVQFFWTIGRLAKELKTTKKALRQARKILTASVLKDEFAIGNTTAAATFHYGFRNFVLKKKKRREIFAPHPKVQEIFQTIGKALAEKNLVHEKAFGFVKKRNVQKAVSTLLGNTHFFSFDISEAFPSITAAMIEEAFIKAGFGKELTAPLAWMVTYYYNGQRRLPQGSSCSPPILNLVYSPMCQKIDTLCKEYEIRWFVYADDFNFAAEKKVPEEIKEKLLKLPAEFGFAIKKEKNKDNLGKTIPHMLGLTIVEQKIHIRRSIKKKIRRIIYMAWKYDAYSPKKVSGMVSVVYQTYGEEENWPGWIRKIWKKYQAKRHRDLNRDLNARKGGPHEK